MAINHFLPFKVFAVFQIGPSTSAKQCTDLSIYYMVFKLYTVCKLHTVNDKSITLRCLPHPCVQFS